MAAWLYHFFGIAGTGPYYAFWSGLGSDIGELTIFAGMVALIRKHQCHERWCWRYGHYRADELGMMKCRKHMDKKMSSYA